MKNYYLLRLLTGLSLGLFMTWMAYSVIIAADIRFFNSIQKNEFIFKKDTTTYDVLLLGSSRMKNIINPRVFDSVTNLSSYNAGASGACISEIKTILETYLLKHRNPKYIVLAVDIFTFEKNPPLAYYPTYLTCINLPPIAKAMKEEGLPITLYKIAPFLKVIELNDYYKSIILKAYENKNDLPPGDYIYKGYVSNTTSTILKDTPGPVINIELAAGGGQSLQDIIDFCKKENIKLILTYAPEYKGLNLKNIVNRDYIMHIYDSVSIKNNIPYYRSDKLELSSDPALFVNNGHLNRIGADMYTAIFARQLIADNVLKP